MIVHEARAFGRGWQLPDRREIYEWAGSNVDLPDGAYAEPGPFRVLRSRYLMEPFKAIRDSGVRKVTVCKPIQTGGTLLADVSVPWFLVNRPGPILWSFMTRDVAEDHAMSRAIPLLRNCKGIRHLLPRDDRKMGKTGVKFPHCPLWISGANPAMLQSKSVLFSINDEVWQWEPGRLDWALASVTAYERV